MSESGEYLLYAATAWRQMPWREFKRAFDVLYLKYRVAADGTPDTPRHLVWQALRALDCLGHVDSVFSGSDAFIAAAPPVLCRLPISGLPQAILCGARSPQTRAAVTRAMGGLRCTVSTAAHPKAARHLFLPERVVVEGETDADLAEAAARLQVALTPGPAAWALAEFSGTLDEYASNCPDSHDPEIDWPRADFDVEGLSFRPIAGQAHPVRLSKYQHPVRGTTLCRLWQGGGYKVVDRDWGRYLALQAAGRNVLGYDPRHFLLAVPTGAPLPRLLARACALCSGYAPRPVPCGAQGVPVPVTYDLFVGVPPDIAEEVARRVGQSLASASLHDLLEE